MTKGSMGISKSRAARIVAEMALRESEERKVKHCMSPPQDTLRGCICPPTSEQTCQSPLCPRKPVQFTVT